MTYKTLTITALILIIVTPHNSEVIDVSPDECANTPSCSSCISNSYCKWCVTKSKCTKQSCGNDNIIYPKDLPALMSGPQFCPKVVEPEKKLTIKSGTKEIIVVKITQIHLYMAFTPWKCKITLEGVPNSKTVVAVLIGDSVYCETVEFKNESSNPYINGSVSVIWDYTKFFDGTLAFQVCRCDLDPTCSACSK